MVAQHSYTHDLNKSKQDAESADWETHYRQAFPDFVSMSKPVTDLNRQYQGIDRVVTLEGGKQIFVDEKYRYPNKNGNRYTDVLFEVWSDRERGIPGWINKPLHSDFIAYAFADSGNCYMLPFQQLKRAWKQNEKVWTRSYGRYGDLQTTTTTKNGRTYTTAFVCVPIAVVLVALTGAVTTSVRSSDGLPW